MGLYLLIPLSVLLVFIIGVIFWWSLRSGQFDDMEGPAYKMLMDDRDSPRRVAPKSKPGKEDAEPATEKVQTPDDGAEEKR